MSSVNFNSILNRKSTEIEKPKPRPAGTYLCQIMGLPGQKTVPSKTGGDEMPVVVYTIKPIAPLEDVDQTELAGHPPISTWGNFNRTIDFFLHTEGGQYYHSEWLENVLGIEKENKTVGERMSEAPGKQLLVKMKHNTFVNRQGEPEIGMEIESTAKA